jgi:hypothetical protein
MKIRILLVLFIAVSVFGNSQELSSDTDKCIYFKMLGGKAFQPDYKKAVDLFVKAINKENVNLNCWGIKVLIPQ